MKKKRNDYEAQLQKSIISVLKYSLHDCLFFHVPNGGKRTAAEGAKFKAMGVMAGVADILIFKEGMFYAIELKVGTNPQSKSQNYFQNKWQSEGGKYAIVKSIDELQIVLRKWNLIINNQ